MTTKELCIGNWVTDNNRMPMFVQAIYGDDTVYLDFDGNEADTWETDIEDVKPIEITDTFLHKNGFDNTHTPNIYHKDVEGWHVSFSPMGDGEYNMRFYWPGYYYSDARIKYVHEMQNAAMLITKKELEVKI